MRKSKQNGKGRTSGRKQGGNGRSRKQQDEPSMFKSYFKDALKDIYWAEKHLLKSLPKIRKAATSQELMDAIEDHIEVTENQVERLEEVFQLLGEKAQGKKCEAMIGLTSEAETVIEETEKNSLTRDAALIIATQKVEHYEIATYGGLAQLARTMGEGKIASLLEQTLEEEKETDRNLTEIAERGINMEAVEEEERELEIA